MKPPSHKMSASLDPSLPLVVSRTEIVGNNLTRAETIEFYLQPVYKANSVGEVASEAFHATKSLEQLGIFDNVALQLNPGTRPGEATLAVTVKEKRILQVKAKTYIQNGVEVGVEVGAVARNALGAAETLEFSGLMGGGKQTSSLVQLLFTQPGPRGLPAVFTASADSSSRHPEQAAYEEFSYGTSFKLRSLNGFAELDWTARQRDLLPVRKTTSQFAYDVPEEVISACRPSLKSTLGMQLFLSSFWPNTNSPKEGSSQLMRLEFSEPSLLGGNVSLVSALGRLKSATPLGYGVSLHTSVEFATLRSASNFISLQDRLYLGGPMFLRGFKPRGAGGPRPTTEIGLGGTNRWQARVALEGPSLHDKIEGHTHVFVAAGALSDELSFKSMAIENLKVTCGMGIVLAVGGGARGEFNAVYVLKANSSDAQGGRLQFGVASEFL